MRTTILASVSMALAAAVVLLHPSPAAARHSGGSSHATTSRATVVKRQFVQPRTLRQATVHHTSKLKFERKLVKTPLVTRSTGTALMRKGGPHVKLGKANIGLLPIHKAAAGTATLRGRLALPQSLRPKLTLTQAPKAQFQHRMSPFIQRPWKKAFFWVAVAGIGYLTVPEIYYDRFLGYVSLDDPDYESCINLLSLAALDEDEEFVRERHPMPASAVYRYSAKAAPEEPRHAASGPACSFDPFIERTWSRPYVWVQIPKIGNVTVPEDHYDRFFGYVSAQPADYSAACGVLGEAAAADTVATTSLDYRRPSLQ